MLENVIKRRIYLQKHLDAPLLHERETYLEKIAERGLVRTSLKALADYLLVIIKILSLKDTPKQEVSLERILDGSEQWANLITDHPMKRSVSPSVKSRFFDIALDWLGYAGLLDKRCQPENNILSSLYNTGARAEEAASMKISALTLPFRKSDKTIPIASILGKGRKTRRCPLWEKTTEILTALTKGRNPDDPVFLNRLAQSITRFGVYEMVTHYGSMLEARMPAVKDKRISPHTIRHTTATHLLQAGVDINTIRAWLGHVSVNTTNIYAEVNLEMKAKALQTCAPEESAKKKIKWENDENLLSFLENL